MLAGYAVYDATKGAVEQFTHILAKEFGPRGITVNAVSPGATETETYRIGKSEQFLVSLEAMSAFGRLGHPDEIAAVVAFLASDAAGWVTAQNIRVNGGDRVTGQGGRPVAGISGATRTCDRIAALEPARTAGAETRLVVPAGQQIREGRTSPAEISLPASGPAAMAGPPPSMARSLPSRAHRGLPVYPGGAEGTPARRARVACNCLLAGRFAKEGRPVKGSLANGWPTVIRHQGVLGSWHAYVYR